MKNLVLLKKESHIHSCWEEGSYGLLRIC